MATFVPPSQQQQNTNSRRERGTGFTNLNRILGANTGAGERIGGAMVGNVQNKAQGFQNQFETAQNKFSEDKLRARTQAQDMLSKAGTFVRDEDAAKGPGESDEVYAKRLADSQAAYDERIANSSVSDEDVSNLQNAAYTGPTDIENKQGLLSKATGLRSTGQMLGQNAGRFNLLRSIVAAPGQYTMGQQSLDNTLLGQSKSALDNIKNTQQQLSNTAGRAVTQANLASQLAEGERVNIDNNRENISKNLLNQISKYGEMGTTNANELENTSKKMKAILSLPSLSKDSEQYTNIQNDLFDGEITQAKIDDIMSKAEQFGLYSLPGSEGFASNSLYGDDANLNSLLNAIQFDKVNAGGKVLNEKQRSALKNINKLARGSLDDASIDQYKTPDDITKGDQDLLNQNRNNFKNLMTSIYGGSGENMTASQYTDNINNTRAKLQRIQEIQPLVNWDSDMGSSDIDDEYARLNSEVFNNPLARYFGFNGVGYGTTYDAPLNSLQSELGKNDRKIGDYISKALRRLQGVE